MGRVKCKNCAGSGKVMGGGMMQWDCEHCDGIGKVDKVDEQKEMDYLLTKSSEQYQQAKGKIKALDDNMTDEKAEALLDAELKRTEPKKKVR